MGTSSAALLSDDKSDSDGGDDSSGGDSFNLLKDRETKKQQRMHENDDEKRGKDFVLKMDSAYYQDITRKIEMRRRTLVDQENPQEWLVEDETVLISIKRDCSQEECKSQLFESKL